MSTCKFHALDALAEYILRMSRLDFNRSQHVTGASLNCFLCIFGGVCVQWTKCAKCKIRLTLAGSGYICIYHPRNNLLSKD